MWDYFRPIIFARHLSFITGVVGPRDLVILDGDYGKYGEMVKDWVNEKIRLILSGNK